MEKDLKHSQIAALKAYPKCKPDHIGVYSLEYSTVLYGREGFQKGYEQAEKDTIERVLHYLNENIHMRYDEKLEWINKFKEAMEKKQIYKETEAGLALTWEDIAKIDAIILDINNKFAVDCSKEINRQSFYEEVLRQFNETFR